MTTSICSTCLKPKATFHCGICATEICKKCTQFLDEDEFSFLQTKPIELCHQHYCINCYNEKVTPQLESYASMIQKAGGIHIFFKGQGKETRNLNIKRPDVLLEVKDCADYDETLLRLAFLAAQGDYNVIVDVEVESEKVQNGSFQNLKWHGTAIPSYASPEKLERQVDPKFTKW